MDHVKKAVNGQDEQQPQPLTSEDMFDQVDEEPPTFMNQDDFEGPKAADPYLLDNSNTDNEDGEFVEQEVGSEANYNLNTET